MEKALELLKKIERQCQEFLDKNLEECIDDYDVEGLKKFHIETKEALTELEEAMKPKSCDGCIREEEDMQDPHCAFCLRACKDNYEPKE